MVPGLTHWHLDKERQTSEGVKTEAANLLAADDKSER